MLETYTSINRLEIKSVDDRYAIVKGYGVVFHGRDISKNGDTFLPETDYGLNRLIGTPVYIEHSLEGFTKAVGEIINYTIDEIGILVEAKIDKTVDKARDYLEKIARGLVGWSSATAGHLARRIKNVVTKWPIVEMSLTTHPAEPRTITYGLHQIKSVDLLSMLEAEQENGKEQNSNSRGLIVNTKIIINTKVR